MTTTATDTAPGSNPSQVTKGGNSDTFDRLTIKKDLGQFEGKIGHYPEEVKDDVTFIYSLNLAEFSGQYAQLANIVRTQGRLNYSDQYFYQLLSGEYFRPDPKKPGAVLGSVDNLREVAGWLRNWALF